MCHRAQVFDSIVTWVSIVVVYLKITGIKAVTHKPDNRMDKAEGAIELHFDVTKLVLTSCYLPRIYRLCRAFLPMKDAISGIVLQEFIEDQDGRLCGHTEILTYTERCRAKGIDC